MSRIAIFVEGGTEAELTVRILTALCGQRGINIDIHRQHSGMLHFIESRGDATAQLYALIANCTCDGQVKTQIRDRYSTLVGAGYTRIVGLRDVYPLNRMDIPKIVAAEGVGLPIGTVPIDLHLAIMEVEAWFLDEVTHFERVHPNLTVARLLGEGFDVQNSHGETWAHPADTLHQVYKLEGLAYKKTKEQIRRTVNALSMDELYFTAANRSASLARFIESLETALFPPA